MADAARTTPHAVISELSSGSKPARAHAHVEASPLRTSDLYELLRRLEASAPEAPRLGRASRLSEDKTRLGQRPSMAFPAGLLASVRRQAPDAVTHIDIHGLGLLGPNGPLPLHLTEYVWQRIKHHADHSLASFLNLFHHRLLSFLYRAWVDANPAVSYDRPHADRFQVYLGALFGMGTAALRDKDALGDDCRRHYAGRFADPVANPEGLCALIEGHFGLPAQVEEFVGEWSEIPDDHRWRVQDPSLGAAAIGGRLGVHTHLGQRAWLAQGRFRVVLGPLTRLQFQRVAPAGADLVRLKTLVRAYAGDTLRWDLRLTLRQEAVPALQLGAAELGRSAWLWSKGDLPQDDLTFEP